MEERRGSTRCLLQVLTAVLVLCGRGAHGITEAQLLPFGTGPPELTLATGNDVVETFNVDIGTLQVNGNQVQTIGVSLWY